MVRCSNDSTDSSTNISSSRHKWWLALVLVVPRADSQTALASFMVSHTAIKVCSAAMQRFHTEARRYLICIKNSALRVQMRVGCRRVKATIERLTLGPVSDWLTQTCCKGTHNQHRTSIILLPGKSKAAHQIIAHSDACDMTCTQDCGVKTL